MRICVFGLGEAGSEIAAGLAAAGAHVTGFDPAEVGTPEGVVRHDDPAAAVTGVEVVVALTAAADSRTALTQALDRIPAGAHYADFSTAAPSLKRELAGTAGSAGLRFTDVALMAPVPGRGISTPALASGPGADALAAALTRVGMDLAVVGGEAGTAATHKLLRSVVVKGLAAVVVESMEAARAAGLAEATWENLVDQITVADERFLRRLVLGTGVHAERRMHEMEAAAAMLQDLGVDPVMTRSTVESLGHAIAYGVPSLPVERKETSDDG